MNENEILQLLEQRTIRKKADVHQILVESIKENRPILGIIQHRNGSMTLVRPNRVLETSVLYEIAERMRPITFDES